MDMSRLLSLTGTGVRVGTRWRTHVAVVGAPIVAGQRGTHAISAR